MLTKKKLRKWINVSALVIVLSATVGVWFVPKLSLGEKGAATAVVLTALRATVPSLKKEAQDAVDGADLPEDEPAEAAK